MQFVRYDLGYLSGGEIVEVTLGSSANVKLLDSSNFQSYQSGRPHRYFGEHVTRSPYRIPVPNAGHWYVAIDLGGYSGTIRSSVRTLPGVLPPASAFTPAAPASRPATAPSGTNTVSSTMSTPASPLFRPLSSIPSLVQHDEPSGDSREAEAVREYDVFISHASEDKDEIVRPLAHALQSKDLRVWYDEFELRIGDSLRRSIDKGLANSRFGLVVLSPAFLDKGWTNYELDGIVTRSVSGEQVLLPIWHNLSKQEVMKYSPSLADKVARSTSNHTVVEIAAEIAEVVLPKA